MKKKILITLCLLAIPLAVKAVTPTITQNNSQNTSNYNTWFNTGVAAVFGNYPNADIYYDGTNLVIDILHGGGKVSIPDEIITTSTITGANIATTGTIKSTSATGVGAQKLSGANTACNTTCTSGGCLFGLDLAAGASAPVLVECASATADTCLCMQ